MRAYWTELRRSPLRWVLPVLLTVELGSMFTRQTEWIGIWPQAAAAVQRPAMLTAPLVAAAASWAAGRARREGMETLLANVVRPRWRSEAVTLAATVTYVLVPVLVGAVAAIVVSAGEAGPGFLWPSYLLLAVAYLVTNAAFGHLCGRSLPGPVLNVLAAAAGAVALGLWSGSRMYPLFTTVSGSPEFEVTSGAVAVRALLAAAVVAFALASGYGLRYDVWARGLACGAAVALVAVVALGAPRLQTPRTPPAEPLCTNTQVVICLWPEHAKYLDQVTAMAERTSTVAPGLLVPPAEPLYEAGAALDGSRYTFALSLHPWTVADVAASALLGDHLNIDCAENLSDARTVAYYQRSADIRSMVTAAVYGGIQPSNLGGGWDVDWEQLWAVVESGPEGRTAWLTGQLATIEAFCVDA